MDQEVAVINRGGDDAFDAEREAAVQIDICVGAILEHLHHAGSPRISACEAGGTKKGAKIEPVSDAPFVQTLNKVPIIAEVEDEQISPETASEDIAPRPANYQVGAVFAKDHVGALTTLYDIDAVATFRRGFRSALA